MTLMNQRDLTVFLGPQGEFDQLIDWKAGGIAVLKHYNKLDTITRGAHMQVEFTMSLRVDFADRDKIEPLKQTMMQAAAHCLATARLLSDNPKSTQISLYGEDFYTGPQEIKLLEDMIAKGLTQIGDDEGEGEGISSELAGAVKNG